MDIAKLTRLRSGHAPAGGCAIAICSDYRLMTTTAATPKARIGLNEVAIGVLVPKVRSYLGVNHCLHIWLTITS